MATDEQTTTDRSQRKSLAVDQATYDLLNEVCFKERRSKIDQLKILIEAEHERVFAPVAEEIANRILRD